MTRIAFRVDASPTVGLGHLSRCLALAARLRQRGATCHFVGNQAMQPWAGRVEEAGHVLGLIDASGEDAQTDAERTRDALSGEAQAEWMVVDHYGLDARWHERVRPAAQRLLALDDLADRPLAVDAVLDPSPCADEAAYRALTPPGCVLRLGPSYCLLREEFANSRPSQAWPSDGPRIHLALGGTDSMGHTEPMARLLLSWFPQASVVAVLGVSGEQAETLAALAAEHPSRLHVAVDSDRMARTMIGCSCAVGAPGGTLWERFCLGMPTACVTTTPAQRPVIDKLARAGWLLNLGDADRFADGARATLAAWLADESALKAQRQVLMSHVDGRGAERIAAWMMGAV